MTIVLVHGNPETEGVWSPLVNALDLPDVVRLSPRGFGVPTPPGWSATPQNYQDWLASELGPFRGAVDLIGHDWGGAHVVNVAMARPDLLRSWCTDGIGMFDPDFTWHAVARVWQTAGAGEKAAAELTAQEAAYLASIGVPADIASTLAPGCADVSARAVTELYRAAQQPLLSDLGRGLPAAARRPGLVLLATGDAALGSREMRQRSAARAGAKVEFLPGLGHWWMIQDPGLAAALLRRFWSALPS